jgi:hypothetical protein
MKVDRDPFQGKTTSQIVLLEPRLVCHVLSTRPINKREEAIYKLAPRMIERFDELPIELGCSHAQCDQIATTAHIEHPSGRIALWCDEHACEELCDLMTPLPLTYGDIVEPLLPDGWRSAAYYRRAIRQLAEMKGLPKGPLTAKRAQKLLEG